MTRDEMITKLVDRDIESIRTDILLNDDVSFLDCILRGDMWVPYNNWTDSQLISEINELELGIEE